MGGGPSLRHIRLTSSESEEERPPDFTERLLHYPSENRVPVQNALHLGELCERLLSSETAQTVVAINDFIGSGNTAIEGLKNLAHNCGEGLAHTGTRIIVTAVCGLGTSQHAIEAVGADLGLKCEVYVPDILGEEDCCFSRRSGIFDSEVEREQAQELSEQHGTKLYPRWPLGYANGQLLVAFEDIARTTACPYCGRQGRVIQSGYHCSRGRAFSY